MSGIARPCALVSRYVMLAYLEDSTSSSSRVACAAAAASVPEFVCELVPDASASASVHVGTWLRAAVAVWRALDDAIGLAWVRVRSCG